MLKLFAASAATLALAAGAPSANAAVFVFTAGTTTYTQNFDTLARTGTGTFAGLPGGVLASESGSNQNGTYAAGTGSDNQGNTYSFGPGSGTAASDRALGGLRSGTLIPQFGFGFTNDTGQTITELAIAFTGEQWRLGANGRADRLDFQYALNNNGTLANGSFVDVDALDFTSPSTSGTGPKNGNLAGFRTAKSATITGLTIEDGQNFVFRFNDVDATGADDGLAVDDFSLSLTFAPVVAPVPEPASWAMMIGGFALLGATARRRKAYRVLA